MTTDHQRWEAELRELKGLAFRSYDGDTHGLSREDVSRARQAERFLSRNEEDALVFDIAGSVTAGLLRPEPEGDES